MEDDLVPIVLYVTKGYFQVLTLIVVEDDLVLGDKLGMDKKSEVLILIVVEDDLVLGDKLGMDKKSEVLILVVVEDGLVLIPYNFPLNTRRGVLILVVVEDGLVRYYLWRWWAYAHVLILVVVEDGLVLRRHHSGKLDAGRLNPCCSGRWSRTRPYKTLLIINKLKNFAKQIFTFLNRKLAVS